MVLPARKDARERTKPSAKCAYADEITNQLDSREPVELEETAADDGGNATLQRKKKKRNVAKKIATQTNDASWVEIEHEHD